MSRSLCGVVCLLAVACSMPMYPPIEVHCDGSGGGDDPVVEASGSADPACFWDVEFDLTGSVFEIDAQEDFTIVVQEPYGDDHNTGPGSIVLRFPNGPDGEPGEGAVSLVSYDLVWDFVTGINGLATVHTDIDNLAAPVSGSFAGTLSGDVLAWSAPAALEVCQDGLISCNGMFCGMGGSPQGNSPASVAGCAPWILNDFTVSDDRASIAMAPATVSNEDGAHTTMEFHGVMVGRTQICP